MISQPSNIVLTQIPVGIRITWDDGDNPAGFYEIWCSIDAAEYIKIVGVKAGVETYDHVVVADSLKYKIKGISHLRNSLYAKGKFDYDDYTIQPLAEDNGSPLHVEFQRGDMMFASKAGYLMWSNDKGYTFTDVAFTDSSIIVFSYIFSNGNVLFATTKNELWLGKNSLITITQKYLKDTDDSNFVFHTPVNPLYPGIYFKTLNINEPVYQEGIEMLVIGNYSMYAMNQVKGATPSLVYYSVDKGETTKVAYKFGLGIGVGNYDDGTKTGGITGTHLGDPANDVVCTHIHYVTYEKYTNEWFVWTGETGVHLRGTYNISTDTWSLVKQVASGDFYRSGGMFITPTHYLLLSDDTNDENKMGIWSVIKTDLENSGEFIRTHAVLHAIAPSIIYGDVILAPHWNDGINCITVSLDGGVAWNDYYSLPLTTPPITSQRLVIVGYPNSDGDFVVTPYKWGSESPYGKQSYLIKFK